MKSNLKSILIWILIISIILATVALIVSNQMKSADLVYSEVVDLILQDKVKTFYLANTDVLTITRFDDTQISIRLRSSSLFFEQIGDYLKDPNKKLQSYDIQPPKQTSLIGSMLPYIIIMVIMFGLWFFMMNKVNGTGKIASFGKSKAKVNTGEKVTFDDVAGADEEKEELVEVVEFLKNPKKYIDLGARIPRGVLLVGPPGTGKTLLAKAVAGEAGVPFFSMSGSDFVEMYVGVGASRVRDLFDTARKANAAIIFIDEIDAVGRHRGAGLGGGHDEREQTLNQLLVEMDGFGTKSGIIVMAATNRPDILDPALLRPGRFDRQVTVNYPDLLGREAILKVHSRNKHFEENVDLLKVAQTTVGFTGADLANLLNEAALLAARKSKSLIGMDDIEEAWIKIEVGTQKKNNKIKPEEKKKTAYHEAGHAILAYVLPSIDPVRQISIIPSGRALGYTLNPPVEDKFSVYKNELKEQLSMILGGRAAEEIVFSDISGGASNDISRATQIATNMVTKLGMSDVLGNIRFGNENSSDEVFLGRDFNQQRNYSEETAAIIDKEIKALIDNAYVKAKEILIEYRDKLDFISDFLMKYEIMDDAQFDAAMNSSDNDMGLLDEMVEAKRKKSEEENEKRQQANARREQEEREKTEAKAPHEIELENLFAELEKEKKE